MKDDSHRCLSSTRFARAYDQADLFVLLYLFMILNFFPVGIFCLVIFIHDLEFFSCWNFLSSSLSVKHSLRSCLRPSRPSLSVVLRRLADPFGEKNFFVNRFKVWSDIFLNFFIFLVICFCYILF